MGRNLLLFICSVFIVVPVWSQTPADNSQESAVIEKITTHRHFEKDGTSTEEVGASIRVQSEAGVEEFGQLVFGYSSATEKLLVDYVRVRKSRGELVNTPESNAQDLAPEILVSAPMYSDFRQRHITVVGLRPGIFSSTTPPPGSNHWQLVSSGTSTDFRLALLSVRRASISTSLNLATYT